MPTTGPWQDGLEHEAIVKYEAGLISVVWLTEASEIQPDIGWDVGDTNVAFSGSDGRLQPDLGGANSTPSQNAWLEAQDDTNTTTTGTTVDVEHTGTVDVPQGGGVYSQADTWNVATSDAHLLFEQTPAFENSLHFVPPSETWPANTTVEIEGPRRLRDIVSIAVSGWTGLTGDYEGHYQDFGDYTGWPASDDAATPNTLRAYADLPTGTGTWVPLDADAAQALVDAVQAGSAVDLAEFARAGFVHNDTWPGIWGATSYEENPGLPTVWFRVRFRTCRYRFIYDAVVQPPQRVFPREDGLIGPGARRNYPPPRSRQRSSRVIGGYL